MLDGIDNEIKQQIDELRNVVSSYDEIVKSQQQEIDNLKAQTMKPVQPTGNQMSPEQLEEYWDKKVFEKPSQTIHQMTTAIVDNMMKKYMPEVERRIKPLENNQVISAKNMVKSRRPDFGEYEKDIDSLIATSGIENLTPEIIDGAYIQIKGRKEFGVFTEGVSQSPSGFEGDGEIELDDKGKKISTNTFEMKPNEYTERMKMIQKRKEARERL